MTRDKDIRREGSTMLLTGGIVEAVILAGMRSLDLNVPYNARAELYRTARNTMGIKILMKGKP